MKTFHEEIDVELGADGLPARWRWRARAWRVLGILDRWVLRSRWWTGRDETRHYLLVDARPVDARPDAGSFEDGDSGDSGACAVELYLRRLGDTGAEAWILARILH